MEINSNEGLQKQNILIKDMILPFLKYNHFRKTGNKYIRDYGYFYFEAVMLKHRYEDHEEIENIRLNIKVYSKNSYKYFSALINFGDFHIPEWAYIETDENTNIDELKIWFKNRLNDLQMQLDKYSDIELIIERYKNRFLIYNTRDLRYWFAYGLLLKDNNKIKEFKQWHNEIIKRNKKMKNDYKLFDKRIKDLEKLNENNDNWKNKEYRNIWFRRESNLTNIKSITEFLESMGEKIL